MNECCRAALQQAADDLDRDPMKPGWDPVYRQGFDKALSRLRVRVAPCGLPRFGEVGWWAAVKDGRIQSEGRSR